MISKMITVVIAITLGLVARAAQGETIESRVSQFNTVPVPGAVATELTHINLHHGNWLIGGVVNVFESAQTGTVFVTGGIDLSVNIPEDGTSPVSSAQIGHRDNVILNVSLPSRMVKIPPQGATVYITVFSNQPGQPAPHAFAWGYISATLTD